MKLSPAILIAVCICLTACVGTVHTYEGEKKPPNEVAIIKAKTNEFSGASYFVNFASYADISKGDRKFKDVGGEFIGWPSEMHMLPGKYLIRTNCYIRQQYAFPSVSVEVLAGITYEVTCRPVPDKLSTVEATYNIAPK
ncbi:MAG: hypothetical protein WA173_06800 [Pseudomonas sp.]|uniref:hypothetical protein n=1 Tax=Pseudomonas sp. TaxID=306 RepID=UPI003BB7EF8B